MCHSHTLDMVLKDPIAPSAPMFELFWSWKQYLLSQPMPTSPPYALQKNVIPWAICIAIPSFKPCSLTHSIMDGKCCFTTPSFMAQLPQQRLNRIKMCIYIYAKCCVWLCMIVSFVCSSLSWLRKTYSLKKEWKWCVVERCCHQEHV